MIFQRTQALATFLISWIKTSSLGSIFLSLTHNYTQRCVGMKSCSNSAYSSSFLSLFPSVNHWSWRWHHLPFRKHVSRSKEFSQWRHEHVVTPKEAAGDPTTVVPKLLSFLRMLCRCTCLKLGKINLSFFS